MSPSPPPGLPERYRPQRLLGRGGFGSVWAMADEVLGREVALKVLEGQLDDEGAARFLREAKVTAGLRHPHVVAVFDFGRTEAGVCWIAYELVEGQLLATREGRLRDPEELARWGHQLAEALQTAHRAGIVHRDVKPDNVILRGTDAVLIDFGVAHDESEQLTATGMILGTPAFMAPELWRGEPASPASDQWALAATLWTTATGDTVYGSEGVPEILAALERGRWPASPRRGDLPPGLEATLRQGLAAEPAMRFPSLAAMAAALAGGASTSAGAAAAPGSEPAAEHRATTRIDQPTTASPVAATARVEAPPPSAPEPPSRPGKAAALGLALLGAVALGIALEPGHRDSPPPTTSPHPTATSTPTPHMAALLGRARQLRERLAPDEPLRPGSATFLTSGLHVPLERLTDLRLPQTFGRLLRAIEAMVEAGESIPAPHDVQLARSLHRFLERLRRQADPQAFQVALERVEDLHRLTRTLEDVNQLSMAFLRQHPPRADAPPSHLLLRAALATDLPWPQEQRPRDHELVALYEATLAALAPEPVAEEWVSRAGVLRQAIGARASRPAAPCPELGELLRRMASQLEARFPGADFPWEARRLYLDLALTAWRLRGEGDCPTVPTFALARQCAEGLLARGGLANEKDLSPLGRAINRLADQRPPDEGSPDRQASAELMEAFEHLYWRSLGPRGHLLEATYDLRHLLGTPRGKDTSIEDLPPIGHISTQARAAPRFPRAIAELVRRHREAQAEGVLSVEDRKSLRGSLAFLLSSFDGGLGKAILLSSHDPIAYQAHFKANSDALRDEIRNAILGWQCRDGLDDAFVLMVYRAVPPGTSRELDEAVEAALSRPGREASPKRWLDMGRGLGSLVISHRLPEDTPCQMPTKWLVRLFDQARALADRAPETAARCAAVLVRSHWYLATEGRPCDRLRELRLATQLTREAMGWSTYVPSGEDGFDWYQIRGQVRAWSPESPPSAAFLEAKAALVEALDDRWTAISAP